VGRDAELAVLRESLQVVRAGTQRLVLVEGEPGIGKSALLRALAQDALPAGFVVHAGRAQEIDHDRPFGALIAALGGGVFEGALASSRGALPDFAPSPADRFRVIDTLVEHIASECERVPMVLVLDDIQWADSATLFAVQQLNDRLALTRLALVLASRPIPRSAELRRLLAGLRSDSILRIRLQALAGGDVARLTQQLTGHPPSAQLLDRTRLAGGNPLYVKELLSALRAEKQIIERDGASDVIGSDVPASLSAAIIRQLAFLSAESLKVLRWAAVLGSTFRVDDLALVVGGSMPALIDGLEDPLEAGVLVERNDRLGFSHDLVHDVVYRDIPPAIRAAMHVEVAEAMARAGRAAIEIAPHYSRGVRERNLPAAEWLARAGRDVAASSPQSAVDLFRRAMELSGPGDALRATVALDLVRALLWSGEWAASEQLARESLLTETDSKRLATLAFILGRSLVYRARTIESIDAVERALDSGRINEEDTIDLLADLSIRLPLAGRADDAERVARRVLESKAIAAALARRTALSGLALAEVVRGHARAAVETARSALPAGHRPLEEAVEHFQPDFYLAIALTAADQLDDAVRVLAPMRRRAEEMGLAWAAGLAGILIGHVHYLHGKWDDALVELRTGLTLCSETGTHVWSVLGWSLVATICARRGEPIAAESALGKATQLVADGGPAHLWYERYLYASAGNGWPAAWSEADRLSLVGARQVLGPPAVRAAAAAGNGAVVAQISAAMSEFDKDPSTDSQRASALCCRAYADNNPELAAQAADLFAGLGRMVEAAEAHEDVARIVAAVGGANTRIVEELTAALNAYDGFGAVSDVARVEQALRRAGVRRGVAGSRRRPSTGWASLTDTEREVVTLAAQGLTNKEIADRLFVSHRTVGSHMSSVFGKIGISSRVELAAAVAAGALASR
jgi:DNA-binding CsgD family transcriptional regulator